MSRHIEDLFSVLLDQPAFLLLPLEEPEVLVTEIVESFHSSFPDLMEIVGL